MDYWVYILKSQTTGKFYIGQTSNIQKRLNEHNHKRCKYTSSGIPWTLVYQEAYRSRKDAIIREQFLKSPQGWQVLKRIKHDHSRNHIS